jgi:hypothetical protein
MELNTTPEATSFAATQKRPKISWNPKVHHRIFKGYATVTTMSQTNTIYNIPFYLSKIQLNIIHPSTSCSSE